MISQGWPQLVGLIAVLLLSTALLLRTPIKHWFEKLSFKRAVQRLGIETINDLVLPDGMEGFVFIDYVILTPPDILVVSVKKYPGIIFASENIDQWTQLIGKRSYKFDNPLREVQVKVIAVKQYLPDTHVKGLVIFHRGSSFPKGKPDGVKQVNEIVDQKSAAQNQTLSQELEEGWNMLRDLKGSIKLLRD